MLIGVMCMPVFAAGAIKAGETAVVAKNLWVYEQPDRYGSKSICHLSKGTEVDVLEAYISGEGGKDGKWHKIRFPDTFLAESGTGYIEALQLSGLDMLNPLGAAEPETVSASVLVDAPTAGAKPDGNIRLGDPSNMTVDSYKWSGAYDTNGRFVAGNKNTLTVKISLTAENLVFSGKRADHTIDVTYSGYTRPLYIWAGGFAASMLNSTIENCYTANGKNNFNLTKGANAPEHFAQQIMIGGFTADLACSTMTNCFSDADITVTGDEMMYLIAGGLTANIMNSDITSCYNAGDVTLPLFDIAGGNRSVACGMFVYAEMANDDNKAEYSHVTNCYNTGDLTANEVAGLAYYARSRSNCTFTNCYSIGALTIDEAIRVTGLPGKTPFVYLQGGLKVDRCYADGNSVSGSAWKYSTKLGRKVLAAIPEDSFVIPTVDAITPVPQPENVSAFVDALMSAWHESAAGNAPAAGSPNPTYAKAQITAFIRKVMHTIE